MILRTNIRRSKAWAEFSEMQLSQLWPRQATMKIMDCPEPAVGSTKSLHGEYPTCIHLTFMSQSLSLIPNGQPGAGRIKKIEAISGTAQINVIMLSASTICEGWIITRSSQGISALMVNKPRPWPVPCGVGKRTYMTLTPVAFISG